MINRALEPPRESITIPKRLQQTYGAALKKKNKRDAKVQEFNQHMDTALIEAEFHSHDLLKCCARVLALACDCDLVFVGRSPEPLFDHLSGLLYDTPLKHRLTLLHYSNGRYIGDSVDWNKAISALRVYLTAIKLDPISIVKRKRPVAFIDIVDTGSTFYDLFKFYARWSSYCGLEWKKIRSKIRVVGIVGKDKTSPKTFRWQQQAQWKNILETNSIKNTSVDGSFLCYMGSWAAHKATVSFGPRYWGIELAYVPPRSESNLIGLQLALNWFNLGRTDQRRKAFASELSKQAEMKQAELREIVLQLRKRTKEPTESKSGRQLIAGVW